MTVCSTPETNAAVSWRPNRIIAPPMKKSTMSTIQNAAAHANLNAVNASRAEVLPDIRAKG